MSDEWQREYDGSCGDHGVGKFKTMFASQISSSFSDHGVHRYKDEILKKCFDGGYLRGGQRSNRQDFCVRYRRDKKWTPILFPFRQSRCRLRLAIEASDKNVGVNDHVLRVWLVGQAALTILCGLFSDKKVHRCVCREEVRYHHSSWKEEYSG